MGQPGSLEWIEQEVSKWQSDGLITEDQAQAIRARYEQDDAQQRKGLLGVVLAFLGALMVGIGICVFIAANWQYITGEMKLLMILVVVVVAYTTGYNMRYVKDTYRGTGNALIFLGALSFGAAIFLVAQGFHVNANAPSLQVIWAVGIIPMAYLLTSPALMTLSIVNLCIALGWASTDWFADDLGANSFLSMFLIAGVIFYGLSLVHGEFENTNTHKKPLGILGLWLMFFTLLPFSFPGYHIGNDALNWREMPQNGILVLLLLIISGFIIAVIAGIVRRNKKWFYTEPVALIALMIVAITMLFSVETLDPIFVVILNLLMLGLTVGVVAIGYMNREPAWINSGMVFFAALICSRYCDWFWKLLPQSVFFIGAGLILILGGMWLERTRRTVIVKMRDEEVQI